MRLGVKAALVDGHLVHGDVAIDGEHVDAVGLSPAGRTGLAVPGLIDLQINGFDGVDFTSAGTDDYRHVATRLAATGDRSTNVRADRSSFRSSTEAQPWL